MTPTQPQLDLARRDPTYPCGVCGQVVTARQLHTHLHCVLYKNRVNPADYGLVIVRREDWEKP
jgi:hypothetical protein